MSTIHYIDSRNGHRETVDSVSAWVLAFVFGPFFFLFKGMIGWFFIAGLLNLFTFGLAWIPLSFFAPSIQRQNLVSRGFMTKEYAEKKLTVAAVSDRIEPSFN